MIKYLLYYYGLALLIQLIALGILFVAVRVYEIPLVKRLSRFFPTILIIALLGNLYIMRNSWEDAEVKKQMKFVEAINQGVFPEGVGELVNSALATMEQISKSMGERNGEGNAGRQE